MNKSDFLKELSSKTGYGIEECNLRNSVVEDTMIIGKKNKEKMIERFEKELNLNNNESNKLYEIVMNIISNEIKNKFKRPFKSQD